MSHVSISETWWVVRQENEGEMIPVSLCQDVTDIGKSKQERLACFLYEHLFFNYSTHFPFNTQIFSRPLLKAISQNYGNSLSMKEQLSNKVENIVAKGECRKRLTPNS